MTRARIRMALAAAALAAIPAMWPTAASAAEPGGVLVSFDGATYSTNPSGHIFPADLVLVPGSQVTGTVWVKNASDRTADLRVAVADTTATSVTFIEQLTLSASTDATPEPVTVRLGDGMDCTPLLTGELIESHTVIRVDVTLALSEAVENSEQGSSANARLAFSLTEPDAPTLAGEDCETGGLIPVIGTPDRGSSGGAPSEAPSGAPADDSAASPSSGSQSDPTPNGSEAPAMESGGTQVYQAARGEDPHGAPPVVPTAFAVLFPWMAITALVAGAVSVVIARLRNRKTP